MVRSLVPGRNSLALPTSPHCGTGFLHQPEVWPGSGPPHPWYRSDVSALPGSRSDPHVCVRSKVVVFWRFEIPCSSASVFSKFQPEALLPSSRFYETRRWIPMTPTRARIFWEFQTATFPPVSSRRPPRNTENKIFLFTRLNRCGRAAHGAVEKWETPAPI